MDNKSRKSGIVWKIILGIICLALFLALFTFAFPFLIIAMIIYALKSNDDPTKKKKVMIRMGIATILSIAMFGSYLGKNNDNLNKETTIVQTESTKSTRQELTKELSTEEISSESSEDLIFSNEEYTQNTEIETEQTSEISETLTTQLNNDDIEISPIVPETDVPTEAPTTIVTESPNTESSITYVLNTKTNKFHRPSCSHLPDKNREDTNKSRDELTAENYEACKFCNP